MNVDEEEDMKDEEEDVRNEEDGEDGENEEKEEEEEGDEVRSHARSRYSPLRTRSGKARN